MQLDTRNRFSTNMLLPLTLGVLLVTAGVSSQNTPSSNQGKPPAGIAGRYGGSFRPPANLYPPNNGKPCNCPDDGANPGSYDFGNPDPVRPDNGGSSDFGKPDPYRPDGGSSDFGNPDPVRPDNGGSSDFGKPDPYRPDGGSSDFGKPDPYRPDGGSSDFGKPDPYRPDGGSSDFGKPDPIRPDYPNDDTVIDGKPIDKEADKYDPSAGEDYSDTGAGGGEYTPPSDCDCVPYYQCKDGDIITDGSGIIDPRKKVTPKKEMPLEEKFIPPQCGKFHVCCSSSSKVTEKPYEHYCGIRKPGGVNTRILNHGKKGESEFGEWPWQGAVLKVEGEANHFQCGAVLIDNYHVITVAHCVEKFVAYGAPVQLIVRLGEWDTQKKSEFLPHEDYAVDAIKIHPAFRNNSLWNDVAVLKLTNPVKFAPHIDTICLPNYGESHVGEECVVTGWGKNAYRGGSYSNVLREVHVPVITNQQCQELLRKTRLGKYFRLHDGFMCAGGSADEDSCKGDGGGPLTCYRADGTYSLAGIVSWGIDCGQPYVPGVYIDITKYLDWIKEATGLPLENFWPKA